MTRYCTSLIILLFLSLSSLAQSQFDTKIQTMSDTLANRLNRTGKNRVMVASFVDLQGNITELGRYIAETFSTQLSNSSLEVVDRSRLNDLVKELKLSEDKVTVPENAVKLGKLSGVEYIITGTITVLDQTMDITIKALDIQRGISIAGQKFSMERTDAINNLMRNLVRNEGGEAANVNTPMRLNTSNKSAGDDLNSVRATDMRREECITMNGRERRIFGQICFENQTGRDLFFYSDGSGTNGSLSNSKIGLYQGARNCSPLVWVNRTVENTSQELTFIFRTTDPDHPAVGSLKVIVEGCKVKSMVLTKKNLMFFKK